MRRLNQRTELIRRVTPLAVAVLSGVVLAGALGAVAVKYAPPPPPLPLVRAEFHDVFMHMSAVAGLRLEALTVEGRKNTSSEDILAVLDAQRGTPILSIDVAEARTAIETLPWVKSAQVERQLPDTVHVILQEREPYALWQQDNGSYMLVDREGHSIVSVPAADPGMRLIVGADAPTHAAELFSTLDQIPDLAKRVRAAVRVGERRWNVYLDRFGDGISVRLPEDDVAGAWARLAALEQEDQILERDLAFIDLRIPDRLIVRPRSAPTDDTDKLPKKKTPLATGPLLRSAGPKRTT